MDCISVECLRGTSTKRGRTRLYRNMPPPHAQAPEWRSGESTPTGAVSEIVRLTCGLSQERQRTPRSAASIERKSSNVDWHSLQKYS